MFPEKREKIKKGLLLRAFRIAYTVGLTAAACIAGGEAEVKKRINAIITSGSGRLCEDEISFLFYQVDQW